ncbi:54S ribosomal protein L32, mitochondrial [Hanseniaspora uvarum DSM 2768]|uniref:Large ribosomal subunit protein bL32m n=1 Tax=Hanseniaspora uvarum TaxID=29833 RepID=A0A1E5RJB3_HANUV|nr:hypothetical protein FOG48_00752 [Hanseniaspora uvarum]KAF0278842.1 hypothetical protein FOG50_00313 [Hanseniaspora uvarum]KKA02752.1 54S ribosomal protein L32, mitochondrial [Hanseniaspora uvarum DSM 2768]OEJ87011.1 54S ribosomal protein L32, mitochondrial [Hanseniaspora uvarum]GMM39286.1 mitochondrial 54S ribosomal protein YmL32 [Hanseniaspora uvarum]
MFSATRPRLSQLSAIRINNSQSLIINHGWLLNITAESNNIWRKYNEFRSGLVDLFKNLGIWLAVPKQRVSYSKKRQRQLDLQKRTKLIPHLEGCPICGNFKRKHTLCMNCFNKAKDFLFGFIKKEKPASKQDYLEPEAKNLLYSPAKQVKNDYFYNKKQLEIDEKIEHKRNIKETLPFPFSKK